MGWLTSLSATSLPSTNNPCTYMFKLFYSLRLSDVRHHPNGGNPPFVMSQRAGTPRCWNRARSLLLSAHKHGEATTSVELKAEQISPRGSKSDRKRKNKKNAVFWRFSNFYFTLINHVRPNPLEPVMPNKNLKLGVGCGSFKLENAIKKKGNLLRFPDTERFPFTTT